MKTKPNPMAVADALKTISDFVEYYIVNGATKDEASAFVDISNACKALSTGCILVAIEHGGIDYDLPAHTVKPEERN